MIRVFTGYDKRESIGWHVFSQSVVENSSQVFLSTLSGDQKDGTNSFTYERFRIPDICNFAGWAIFVDGSDMIAKADLAELWKLRDKQYAVQVVKHDYKTRHPRKYVGTSMEADNRDYQRKNWSSVIIWNCAHMAHLRAREKLLSDDGEYLHGFGWLSDKQIGELPKEWNWLVDEYGPNPNAKIIHWTAGIPAFENYKDSPMADEWYKYLHGVG